MARRWLLAFLAAAPHAAADKCDERYPTADCFPDHAAPSCKATSATPSDHSSVLMNVRRSGGVCSGW